MNQPPKFNALPKRLHRLILAGVAVLTLVAAAYAGADFFRPLDGYVHDRLMTAFSPRLSAPSDIAIVDIDEASLNALGQWPWPRYRIAQLLAVLFAEHPRAMGLDILFPEPDRLSISQVAGQFKSDFKLSLPLDTIPESLRDNDGFFGHILAQTRTVGARYFYFDHFTRNEVCKAFPLDIDPGQMHEALPLARGALCNTFKLETKLARAGFINNQYDTDGLLRQTPLLIRHQDLVFPHLALALVMEEQGVNRMDTGKDWTGFFIRAGNLKIPVTPEGFARIHFQGPSGRFPYLSALDILNGNFDPGQIQGKTLLIGSTAMGLKDLHPVATDPHFPGIEISALLLDNIHNNQLIRIPDWGPLAAGLLCLGIGLSMALVFHFRPTPMALLTATLAWGFALALTGTAAFALASLYITLVVPFLLTFLLFTLITFIRFAAEKQAAFNWFRHLSAAQQLTMEIMVSMVETRDPETGEHIVRTQYYAKAVAEELRRQGKFTDILTDAYIQTLFLSVPLHDIGKVGIPDRILLKPARLTDEEFRHMKLHATHGRAILRQAAGKIKGSNYLAMGEDIAGTHHEKWNGQGYPQGLAGEDIPLSGRIMAIADVYDALISKRCYKPPYPHDKAMGIILEEKGKLFDPVIVDAFCAIEDRIKEIARDFGDR